MMKEKFEALKQKGKEFYEENKFGIGYFTALAGVFVGNEILKRTVFKADHVNSSFINVEKGKRECVLGVAKFNKWNKKIDDFSIHYDTENTKNLYEDLKKIMEKDE